MESCGVFHGVVCGELWCVPWSILQCFVECCGVFRGVFCSVTWSVPRSVSWSASWSVLWSGLWSVLWSTLYMHDMAVDMYAQWRTALNPKPHMSQFL